MKKGKRLLILLAIVVAFGVGAYLLNLNTKQQEAAKTAASDAKKIELINATEDKAAKLSFTHKGETIDLAKENGAWVYEPRENFELNTSKVIDLFKDLKDVESVRTVENASTDLTEYGLKDPAVAITVTNADGSTQKISLGDKNNVTGDYYAAVDGKDGVYTLSSDLYNAFDIGLMDLLTAESYPTIGSENVTGLEWSNGQDTATLANKPDGDPGTYTSRFKWFENNADSATLTPVNADAVSTFLKAATGITYDSTVADTKDDLATYGLDKPTLSVTLHYTEDVPQSKAADALAEEAASATAAPTPEATVTAAPSPSESPAVTGTPEASATPSATPAVTSTPTVNVKPTAAVTAAPTATAKPTVAVTAAPTASATASPTATSALSGSITGAIAEDASAVPSETPTTAPTATPEPTIAIQRTITLWFGKTNSEGKVYMTHSKTNRVFLVSADTLTALQKLTAADLRNNVPANIARADLTGMVATVNGVTKTVTASNQTSTSKDGDVTTTVVYQIDGKELKSTLFSLFVNALNEIKAEAYTDKPVAEGATPLIAIKFTQNRTGFETVDAAFYAYDENFDQAVVNGDATMLVNKRDLEQLITYFDGLVATEATPTPAATATPTPTTAQ